jgi:hypothetical protein
MFFPERITFSTVPAGLDLCVPQFISKAISFYIARTLKTHYRALNTGEREGHVRNNNPYLGLQELSGRKQKHKTVWSNHYNQFLASLSLSRPFKGERASVGSPHALDLDIAPRTAGSQRRKQGAGKMLSTRLNGSLCPPTPLHGPDRILLLRSVLCLRVLIIERSLSIFAAHSLETDFPF